jgi:hypothetical protein
MTTLEPIESMATLAGEDLFPTTVVFQDKSAIPDFIRWYKENEAELQKILLRSGAILFRGVNIETVVDFEGVMDSISTKFMAYIDGNSPQSLHYHAQRTVVFLCLASENLFLLYYTCSIRWRNTYSRLQKGTSSHEP